MERHKVSSLVIGSVLVLALTAAAQRPSVFSQASPGLWEIDGAPGFKMPLRQCFPDLLQLAQFEHRNQACMRRITSDGPSTAVIDYSCGGAGFGHSEVALITPRSLRVGTQGISNKLPFNYTFQARRIGDCPTSSAASRH